MLTLDLMRKMWPHGDDHVPGLLEGIAGAAPAVFQKYGLTPIAVAHFMAQSSEECGAGLEMVENDNFTAEQLARMWPSRFTGSMPERYAHNPRMICDVAYGGRMGNAPPPSDDGYDYRGRGLTNCTGKDGYKAVAEKTGIDVVGHPEYFSDPRYALEAAVADFVICGCLPWALKDNVVNVSAMLNDGHLVAPAAINGLAVREQWTARWKAELPTLEAAASAAPQTPAPPAPAALHQDAAAQAAPVPVAPTNELMTLLARIEGFLASSKAATA